jgi:hemolysin activation/secretion protein
MKSISKLSLSAVVASMIATTLYAEVPNSGTILNEIKPPKLERKKSELPSVRSMDYKTPIGESDDIEVYVTSFTITNNTVYDDSVLLEIVKPYTNQKLTLAKIKGIATLLTKYYRENGYFVARAYIPAQELDPKGASLEISIIEGVYGDFKIENSSKVDTEAVQHFMDKLTFSDVISTDSLERQMLLINDLGGVVVSDAKIMPGTEVGTSDFIIEVSPQDKFTGYALVDNYGSKYTGVHRINAGAFINNVSGAGDTLSITGLVSQNSNLKNGRVAYDRFIGNSGLNIGLSASYTAYELGEELKSIEARGETTHLSTYVAYPIIKTRAHTLDTRLTFNHKELIDKTFTTNSKKQTDALTFGLSNSFNTSLFNRHGNFFTSVSITYGDLKLKSDDAKANDIELKSQGDYAKLNFEISQMQTLNRSFYLTTSIEAQSSLNKNLDSSESFSIGGAYGVRAYKDSEQNGDKGYVASMELFYMLPSFKQVSHTLSTFVDHAKVWDNHEEIVNLAINSRTLNSVGLGYNIGYEDLNIKATLAHGFGPDKEATIDDGRANRNLVLVQGLWRF